MKRFWLSVLGPALLAVVNALVPVPASAQTPNPSQVQPRTSRFEGRITQMGSDLFVDHSQVVQLECLRSGIWGTKSLWGRVLTYKG
jgi:hypothetical protein